MRKRTLALLPILSCLATAPAMANWEYDGVYIGDGWYEDDGTRFTMSFRGGASAGFGKTKNKIGPLSAYYFFNDAGEIISETSCGGYEQCYASGYTPAGYGNIGDLPPTKNFESFSFAAGASLGWTLPWNPQWRLEAGWDHIIKSDFNASPLFDGTLPLEGNDEGYALLTSSGAMHSTIQTDIISAMAFYDFFDGLHKPMRTAIPYIGLGIGYADTTTVTNLTDPFGDLSADLDLQNYGTPNETTSANVIDFYQSKYSTNNVAGVLAAGFSYRLTENTFMDLGARLFYIPKAKWTLTNEEHSKHRDLMNAEDLTYINIMLGLRFEF